MLKSMRFYLHNQLRNYNYCLVNENREALIIDPTDAELSIRFCIENHLHPTQIWITHEDLDHYLGANQTSKHFNIPIHCPSPMTHLFDNAQGFNDSDSLVFDQTTFNIKHVPGHTPFHHVFLDSDQSWLISGDILFNYGMGRVRQDQYNSMFNVIGWIKSINDDCVFLNAHDYDLTNLKFAQALEPNNLHIHKVIDDIKGKSEPDRPLSTIGQQKRLNPFLNTHRDAIIKAIRKQSMPCSNELDVFTSLRKWRDTF